MIRIKKYIVVIFLLTFGALGQVMGQAFRISLLTADPGDELYSAFGHSAIRVLDKASGEDYVFNYGTFDFNTPNFYGKFASGKLDYMLSVSTFAAFVSDYDRQGRGIKEQVLDLNSEQTDYMLEFLQVNYQPERRFYRYDFFYDNCATRIRDAMDLVLGDKLIWKDEVKEADEKTFRNLIDEYVYTLTWADLGIDLALGAVIDVDATPLQEQFLPDYMFESFARAEIQGDGPTRPMVKETLTIMEFPKEEKTMEAFNPYWIFWLVAIGFTLITFIGFKKKKLFIGFDLAFFGLLGVIGIVVTLLWFATEHSATKWNWNILWAFPGHLILVKGLWSKTLARWVRKYLLFALIMADAAVVFWILGWQSFHPSIIPLLLVLILRTNYLYYNIGKYRLTSQ
ncbi:MAG: heme/copper-type cytochrome/quinol oxidase subunit 4 [Algoriphagus sp.]|jgi:heme/copper-type cytochrome/quinol oxidase subunit 4